MSKTLPLVISGIIFTLFALVHILRLIYHWEVMVAGVVIPMWCSIVGLIVAGILAIWMFSAAGKTI